MTSQSLSSWLSIKSDDIDCGLAADFDGSLSGLGVELGSSTYNMSEALLALPVFKQESLEAGFTGCHFDFVPVMNNQRWAQNVAQSRFYYNQLGSSHDNEGLMGGGNHPDGHIASSTWAPSHPQPVLPGGRPHSEDDDENACHSQEVANDSPSNDVSGFSLELLRGALVASSETENRESVGDNGYRVVHDGSPPCTYSPHHQATLHQGRYRFSSDKNRFQYILNSATSPATKLNEETLTYLNQGQSYEIKLKKYGEASQHASVKSIIRVVFHDRRLQYAELEQLQLWRLGRPGERLLDIDVPLSTGIFDVTVESNRLNSVSFKWEPNKECVVFVKVHCISTEFTPKKHGGEKGVPFRVQIETYSDDDDGCHIMHCASCQVKVFKPKGADRKQKTDRDKMEKRSCTEKEKYQPSYEVTVLSELPLDQAQSYLQQLAQQELLQPEYNKNLLSAVDTGNVSKWSAPSPTPPTPKAAPPDATPDRPRSDRVVTFNLGEPYSPASSVESLPITPLAVIPNSPHKTPETKNYKVKEDSTESPSTEQTQSLSTTATAVEVTKWLLAHRFSTYSNVFQNFAGSDLLRLTRDDLIQICGLVDGIRLNNALQSKNVRPKLTIYVSQSDESNKKSSPQPPSSSSSSSCSSSSSSSCCSSSSSSSNTQTIGSSQSPGRLTAGSKAKPTSPTPQRDSHQHNPGMARLSNSSSAPASLVSSKRQYREAEEEEVETQAASSSKKQRTRTLRMSQAEVYHAVYLDTYTTEALIEKIAPLFMIETYQIIETFMAGPSGINILVTDDVVQNFIDQSRFHVEAEQDEDLTTKYRLLMKILE